MTEKTAEKLVEIGTFIVTKSADIVAMYSATFGSAFIIKSGFEAAGDEITDGKAKLLGCLCALGGAGAAMYVDKKLEPVVENKLRQFMYLFVEE